MHIPTLQKSHISTSLNRWNFALGSWAGNVVERHELRVYHPEILVEKREDEERMEAEIPNMDWMFHAHFEVHYNGKTIWSPKPRKENNLEHF